MARIVKGGLIQCSNPVNDESTPVADIHEDCICLAVTDAPLRFDGLLHKIVQKFARI